MGFFGGALLLARGTVRAQSVQAGWAVPCSSGRLLEAYTGGVVGAGTGVTGYEGALTPTTPALILIDFGRVLQTLLLHHFRLH